MTALKSAHNLSFSGGNHANFRSGGAICNHDMLSLGSLSFSLLLLVFVVLFLVKVSPVQARYLAVGRCTMLAPQSAVVCVLNSQLLRLETLDDRSKQR